MVQTVRVVVVPIGCIAIALAAFKFDFRCRQYAIAQLAFGFDLGAVGQTGNLHSLVVQCGQVGHSPSGAQQDGGRVGGDNGHAGHGQG